MSYDKMISRPGAAPLMKPSTMKSSKGPAGPAKTQGKPAAHKSTKHK